MAESKKVLGDQNMISWGAPDSNTYGEIQSMTKRSTGDQHPFRDHEGAVKTVVVTDIHDEYEMEVLLKNGATLPKVGDTVEIDNNSSLYVTGVTKQWSNEDAQKVTISARDFPSISNS